MARYSAAKIIVRYHIDEPDEVTSDLAALAYRVGRIAVADGWPTTERIGGGISGSSFMRGLAGFSTRGEAAV
jgi:hypothetical protein